MVHLWERSARERVGLGWVMSVVAALLLLWGCGNPIAGEHVTCLAGEIALEAGGCVPPPCPPGELTLAPGECQPAGLPPDMPCPPGEWLSEDGTCQAAGVPPGECAEGFGADGNGGCNAILPAEACPFGQMAVPGETSCREVAPCGDGPWGTIPVEANTQFVDQAYAGGDSDGTMAKPWTTVQQGVDAAAGGAIVAVTDGVYEEDVRIQGKAARLWGRCPGRVEIRGTGVEDGVVEIFEAGADGSEIRGLAVTGLQVGITMSGASDVRIEQLWVHDTVTWGIKIVDLYGPTSVTVRGSLVEKNHELGVIVAGLDVDAELEATVVRDTQSGSPDEVGLGIHVEDGAKVIVRKCLIQRNFIQGVRVMGSDAELEGTVVSGNGGWGILILDDVDTGRRASVNIRGSVVEQNLELGVRVMGSDAELDATVVRNTLPLNDGFGNGIYINRGLHGQRAEVSIRGCVVESNHSAGVTIHGSAGAELFATVVRDTQPVNGLFGRGIIIQDDPDTGKRPNVSIRGCVVEQNHEIGVFVVGSDADLYATVVRATQPVDGQGGRGFSIQQDLDNGARAKVGIRGCVVEQNHDIGVYVSRSDAELDATVVRETAANADGSFGDGVTVANGTATIQSTTVSGSARAGVANFGSEVTILSSTITCNAFDLNGETFDDIPYSFDGSANWQCSHDGAEDCTEPDTCHVLRAGITPPPPLDPLPL